MTHTVSTVITTIQPPTDSVRSLADRLDGSPLIVIGDKKGPATFDLEAVDFLTLNDQLALDFKLAQLLPTGHYARKNIGYLRAIENGASSIYETDDDNAPLRNWTPRNETVEALVIESENLSSNGNLQAGETSKVGKGACPRFINVYKFFTKEHIWPRGFPLDEVSNPTVPAGASQSVTAPIQQGLANNSPDVDAVWRLVLDRPFDFNYGPSIYLSPRMWCPFNSQSTWWFPVAYPLMYLPSYCSFRMTDIWRSFIAQRCLWELGAGLVFHAPEVVQERNQHNLMKDFADEVPGYTRNTELVTRLERLQLKSGADAVSENLMTCYESLVEARFFGEEELELVSAWTKDLGRPHAARLQNPELVAVSE